MIQKNALTLVSGGSETPEVWTWFCGHCAAPSPSGSVPPPTARVCASCGLGLLLEVREDAVPDGRDAFLVVDSQLLVQAMSREAQTLLGLSEEDAVDKPVAELLVPADAEAQGPTGFAATVAEAAEGRDDEPGRAFLWRADARPHRHLRTAAGGADRPGERARPGAAGDPRRASGRAAARLSRPAASPEVAPPARRAR
jgi:PAS domain-containing protein